MQPHTAAFLATVPPPVADALLVDLASADMRTRMTEKREAGYSGWHTEHCSASTLLESLQSNVLSGHWVDVMNFAAMLHVRESLYGLEPAQPLPTAAPDRATPTHSHDTRQRYYKLDTDGKALPLDATDHAILVDEAAGLMFDVRKPHRGDWESCNDHVGDSGLLGRSWRLPTLDELERYVLDRKRVEPAADRHLFPNLPDSGWVWSGTPYAGENDPASPAFAWGVDLGYGGAHLDGRDRDGLALPVSPLVPSPGQS